MLRSSEPVLFLSLCRAFVEVVYPHCATCFGRCYPNGGTLILDAKDLYDGISRPLSTSSVRHVPKPVKTLEDKNIAENGNPPVSENGVVSGIERSRSASTDEKEQARPILQTVGKTDDEAPNE